MKATQTFAVMLVLACAPAAARAQQPGGAGYPATGQVSVGVYGGVAFNTPSFTAGGNDFGVGTGPVVGLTVANWISPRFGVRGHVAYMRTSLPENGSTEFDPKVNHWLYDLDLLWRPMASNAAPVASSFYVLGGVGAVTSNMEGGSGTVSGCYLAAAYLANGVCVKSDAETKVQGVLGLGADVAPLGDFGALFAEAAVHGHGAPVELASSTTAEKKFVLTPRLSLGLKFRVR